MLVSAHKENSRAGRVYEARKPKNTMCNSISFLNNIMLVTLYVSNNINICFCVTDFSQFNIKEETFNYHKVSFHQLQPNCLFAIPCHFVCKLSSIPVALQSFHFLFIVLMSSCHLPFCDILTNIS